MAILLTGGAGYIGSHTCVELLNLGMEVVVVDNLSNSNPKVLDRVETITEVKVYSNQNTVTLYANGRKVATKTGSRVFTFRVQNLGEMKLEAVSGNLHDSAVIRHVNKPNMSYKLPKDGGNGGNWT